MTTVAAAVIGGAVIGGAAMNASAKKGAGAANAQTAAAAEAAAADREIASRQVALAEQQYADQKALLDQYAPLFKQQIELSTREQAKSLERGDMQWEDFQRYFQPAESELARRSLEYDTPARREAAAQQAAGQVADQFDLSRQAMNRSLESTGAMPGGGQMLALENASRIEEAKAAAGAANNARQAIEDKGLAYLDNAARFGRNMPSTGLQAAGLAGQQGQQAQGAYGSLSAATAAPVQYAAPLFGQAVQSTTAAGNLHLGAAENLFNTSKFVTEQTLGGMQAGARIGGMVASSKEWKDETGDVDPKQALDSLEHAPVKRWRYKGDDTEHIGRYAEDIPGGPMGGKAIDVVSELGLHHASIVGVSKKVDDLAKEVRAMKRGRPANDQSAGLADAKLKRVH